MISLLLPSRKRFESLKELVQSVKDTADNPKDIEIMVYVDDDDDSYEELDMVGYVRGPRIVLSQMWNRCYEEARGPIYQHCGDDLRFRTKGWDTIVKNKFKEYPDKIAFLYGDDGFWTEFGTHGFIHENWVKAVGYFVPPYFSSDYNDQWLNDVAKLIGRHVKIPIMTEHLHFAFNKRPKDQVDEEREAKGARDNVMQMYKDKESERQADAEKLKSFMGL